MTTSAAASAEIAKVAQTAVTTEELLSGDSNILDQLLLMFEKGLNQPIVYWQLASIPSTAKAHSGQRFDAALRR